MHKLGVLLTHPGNTQLNCEFFSSANSLVIKRADVDCICFVETPMRPMIPLMFAMMPAVNSQAFDGTLIATSLFTAAMMRQNLCAHKQVLFSYDLDWMRGNYDFDEIAEVYLDKNVDIVVRSESHASAFESAWNRWPSLIMPSFDCKLLSEAYSDEQN